MKKNIKDYIGTKTAIWIDAHTPEQENAIKELMQKLNISKDEIS